MTMLTEVQLHRWTYGALIVVLGGIGFVVGVVRNGWPF